MAITNERRSWTACDFPSAARPGGLWFPDHSRLFFFFYFFIFFLFLGGKLEPWREGLSVETVLVPRCAEWSFTMASPIFDLEFDTVDDDLETGKEFEGASSLEHVEPPTKIARFPSRSLGDVNRLIGERVPASTKRTTDHWLKLFRTFCDQAKLEVNLREDPAEKIGEALALCYVNSRGQNGQPYQRPSLMGLRAALHRHISSMRRDINIMNGEEFRLANDALDARLKELKRTGEAKPAKHKAIITDADLERLGSYFSDLSSPVVLTEAVWFTITYHFAMRGCENQAQLRKQDLVLKNDEKGHEYFELATAFNTKNHQGGTGGREKVSDGRIQHPKQVAAVKELLAKLNPKSDRLFQMARRGLKPAADSPFFNGLPLGKNTLKEMMKRISAKAKLSDVYTNHCVRATAVQRLVDAGVPETAIIATTGHKQVQSLVPYACRNSDARKSEMAAILDFQPIQPKAISQASGSYQPTRQLAVRSAPEDSSDDFDEIDAIIASCDLEKMCAKPAN